MANETKYYPSFDDLVFEHRNKEYGAYDIRKKYIRTVLTALLIGIFIFTAAIVIPSMRAKKIAQLKIRDTRVVIAEMANDLKQEVPPPPLPPPPSQGEQLIAKYVTPVVVDTIKPEDQFQLATTDEQVETGINKEVYEVQGNDQEETPQEVSFIVEEMPEFPGGEIALLKFISNAIRYPVTAQKTGIQGKVYVTFIVDKDGGITDVRISQGVDPLLDREALRVVKSLPKWNPGKQRGKPVRVSYTIPINFVLQ